MNSSASGANNGASWADAYTNLQSALGTSTCTEVWVKSGTYKPTTGTDRNATFQLKNGVALYGGFAGTETARDQRNPTANVTTLSGDIGTAGDSSDNSCHVVTGATGATLDGFTITAGNDSESYGAGGGMYNNSSSPMLTDVTFSGNSASADYGMGGGMYNSSSNPTLTNVTFSGNSASGDPYAHWSRGGGMYNGNSSPTLTNLTFSGNSAMSGGGMYNYSSSPTIRNTIFWGNTDQIYNSGTASFPVVSYSVVQGGYAGGTYIITTDPMLGSLGNYGGFTQVIPLLAGSSAIDTGNDAVCPATDQRGYARPVDGDGNGSAICDIGAYEAGAVPLPTPTPTSTAIATPTATATPTPTPTVTWTPSAWIYLPLIIRNQ